MRKHKIFIRSTLPFVGRKLDIGMLRNCIRTALNSENVDMPVEVSVLLTDDEGIRVINRNFRQKDVPTDVLSFPMQTLTPGNFAPDMSEMNRDTGCLPLGDIILSVDRVVEQARIYEQAINREMVYLAIHSVLHLLGYDHMDEGEEKRSMRSREEAILKSFHP